MGSSCAVLCCVLCCGVYVVCCCVVVWSGLVLYGEIDVCVVVWCGVAFLAPAGPAENEDQPSTILCFILFFVF